METGTLRHVMRLAALILLLSLLSAASDAGRVRCGENHFQPANDRCTPCRQCGPREVIHQPCSDTQNTVCRPMAATSGALNIRCSKILGVYLEGNSTLTQFKVTRHKGKESKLTRLKRKKLEKTTCKLAQISAKKVLKVHKYLHRECPTESQYVWKNSHTHITCQLCSQCPDGSHVVRSCGGRQDTACSFPAVPDTVQLFNFTCLSTGTHVLVYSDRPHCTSQFHHGVVQVKLTERLCTALKTNLPLSLSTGDHVKKKKYRKRGPLVRSGRNGFLDTPTTVTTVNTTTAATPASTVPPTTATSAVSFTWGDSTLSLTLPSASLESVSSLSTSTLHVADDNDNVKTSSGETSNQKIVAITIAAAECIIAVFILGAILHVGHLLKRQSKRIKETTAKLNSESGYVSLNPSVSNLSSGHAFRGRTAVENRYVSFGALQIRPTLTGEVERSSSYLTTVAEVTTDDSQQDSHDMDAPQRAEIPWAESGYLTRSSSRHEVDADEGSSSDSEAVCVERLTSCRPNADPQVVIVTNVRRSDPHSTDYTTSPGRSRDAEINNGSTTQVVTGARRLSSDRPSLRSTARHETSTSNLTDLSQPPECRAPTPPARENYGDSDFSSGTEDVMEELLSSLPSTRHSLTSSTSRSTTVSMEIRMPLNNDVKMAPLSGWLHKEHNIPHHNVLFNYSASTSTQTDDVSEECPPPVFCSNWQGKKSVTGTGGSLQLSHSDVRLEIPANAVPPAACVDVVMATYTNLPHVRAVLDISNKHYFLSPVAELFAGPDFHFANPVHLYLPNALMTSVSEHHINVFHFHRADNGDLVINLLPSKSACLKKHKATNNQTEPTGPSDFAQDVDQMESTDPSHPAQDIDCTGYYELLPTGQVRVTTTRFCGFTCTVCKEHVPRQPQIHLLATGSHLQVAADTWQVHVRLALWDRKITIADFQRDYLQEMSKVGEQSLSTVEDCEQSFVILVLNIYGPSAANWQHALRRNSHDHVLDVTKRFPLMELLHCNTQDSPRFEEWLMENVPDRVPGPVFQCYIDATNEWLDQGAAGPEHRPKTVTLFVPSVKKTRGEYDEWAALPQATSTRTVLSSKVTNEPARNVPATFPVQRKNNEVHVEVPATQPHAARQPTAGPVARTNDTDGARPQQDSVHSSQFDDQLLFGDGVLAPSGQEPVAGHIQRNLTPSGEGPSNTAGGDNGGRERRLATSVSRGEGAGRPPQTGPASPILAAVPLSGVSAARVADRRPPPHSARGRDTRQHEMDDSIHPAALIYSDPLRPWMSESMMLTGIDYSDHQGLQATEGIPRIISCPGGLGEQDVSAAHGIANAQHRANAREEASTRCILGARGQAGHGIAASAMQQLSLADYNDNCRDRRAGEDHTEMKRTAAAGNIRQETRMYAEDSVPVHGQL